jgi:hypothetical protein
MATATKPGVTSYTTPTDGAGDDAKLGMGAL